MVASLADTRAVRRGESALEWNGTSGWEKGSS
jgi:hypothetical protein